MNKKLITAASDGELRIFASDTLQVDLAGCDTRAKVLAAIGPAWPNEFIFVDDEAEHTGDPVTLVPLDPTASVGLGGVDYGPPVTLTLMETNMPGGRHPAHPSVNGSKELVIQRNVPVTIPYAFYLALKNAQCGDVQNDNEETGSLVRTRVSNYPMTDIQMPPQAEIDAWHARNGARELSASNVAQAAAA